MQNPLDPQVQQQRWVLRTAGSWACSVLGSPVHCADPNLPAEKLVFPEFAVLS